MKQRPILVAVIGYIIGILGGLYFSFGMVLCYILLQATNHKKHKFKLLSIHRYSRYLKLIINKKVILILIIFSFISNIIVKYQNTKYENTYQDGEQLQITAVVVSQKIEKQYYDLYQVKLCSMASFYLYIQVNPKFQKLEYGDKIRLQGEYRKPLEKRNYGGYDDKQYLKTLKVIGRVKVNKIEVVARNQRNPVLQLANQLNLRIKQKIEKNLGEEKASILKGLLLGDTTKIEDEIKEDFQVSNISHVLAISGMHIGYIVLGIKFLGEKGLGKKKTKIITIIILSFYMLVTGFSPSIMRATIMAILIIGADLLYRKSDGWNAIAISLLTILIYNPFLLFNVGLQLSYMGTIGIIIFRSTSFDILNFIKSEKIKEIISVTLSVQTAILPILLYHYNIVGIYFLLTNLLVSFIIGPIMILGFLSLITSHLIGLLKIGIEILGWIARFSQLPFSKIYIPTPNIIIIILYFIGIEIFQQIYEIYHAHVLTTTQKRIKNLIALFYYRFRQKKEKYIKYISVFILLMLVLNFLPKNLKIHFVDVGQGDCTWIITPHKKTILIDGGGNLTSEFDVGKKIVLPYLLDRGYTTIDYMLISHFDQDHVRSDY